MSVLLVTGGSRGIGAAIAKLAAPKGYEVCANYVRARERAEQVAAAVRAEGRRALVVQADVSVEEDIVAIRKAAKAVQNR
jgi:NAD(P)-dependent dehydrogenase (short-subunit alcohol dehydrogenase family)